MKIRLCKLLRKHWFHLLCSFRTFSKLLAVAISSLQIDDGLTQILGAFTQHEVPKKPGGINPGAIVRWWLLHREMFAEVRFGALQILTSRG